MYILISGINNDLGGFTRFKPVLLANVWSGLAEVSDEEAEKLLKYPCVKEITPEVAEYVKKKVNGEDIAYRSFKTHRQEATQNPHAVYAEKKPQVAEVKEDPKELLSVEEVEVDRPLDDVEVKPKAKPRAKKGKK